MTEQKSIHRTRKVFDALTGGYDLVKLARFSVVVFALLNVAAHLYALPGISPIVTFWLEIEVAAFIVIGIVFLLGLRMWYLPSILFAAFNLVIFLLSGVFALGAINPAPLTGHIEFAQYSFGRAFSLAGWVYLIVAGTILLFKDKGSALNTLLRNDKD